MVTERGEKILLVLAFGALLATLCFKRGVMPIVGVKPAEVENQKMLVAADDWIVGDSNVYPDPISRVQLANTRFGPVPGMPPLRQTTQGHRVRAQINNEE